MSIPCLTCGFSRDVAWGCIVALAVVNHLTYRAVSKIAETRRAAWALMKMSLLSLGVLLVGILVQNPGILAGDLPWDMLKIGMLGVAGTWLLEMNFFRLVALLLDACWAKESQRIREWKTKHQCASRGTEEREITDTREGGSGLR
jgi:hypothetical protein